MIQVTPVILCGGSGTRLWPLSRTGFPKQFLCLTGKESLFQQAAQRMVALGNDSIKVAAPVIVSGEEHRFLASEQLREVVIALGTALCRIPDDCIDSKRYPLFMAALVTGFTLLLVVFIRQALLNFSQNGESNRKMKGIQIAWRKSLGKNS
jgi:hypothetical protein